jgi:hypothetical protein
MNKNNVPKFAVIVTASSNITRDIPKSPEYK